MKTLSFLAALLLFSLSARADSPGRELLLDPVDPDRDRVVPLKIYLPEASEPRPVVLFSHGLGGSREGCSYLGRHWAEQGYVAVFTQHAGSDAGVWRSVPRRERFDALKRAASLSSSLARYADVPFVIDQLVSTAFWDAYLMGDEQAKSLLQSERLRDEAGLIKDDRWEWK